MNNFYLKCKGYCYKEWTAKQARKYLKKNVTQMCKRCKCDCFQRIKDIGLDFLRRCKS